MTNPFCLWQCLKELITICFNSGLVNTSIHPTTVDVVKYMPKGSVNL